MENNMKEVSENQEQKDLIWFGQAQILGELMNADPAKAAAEPQSTRTTALKFAFKLKEHIDEQIKERNDDTGASEVYVSSVQLLGRIVNADYQKAINNPEQAIKYAFKQAIASIAEIEIAFEKKESELTEA